MAFQGAEHSSAITLTGGGMKAVFVHGVANRREPDPEAFDEAVKIRRGCFSRWCFEREDVVYFDPYWGCFGAHPDENLASIPKPGQPSVALGLRGLARLDSRDPAVSLDNQSLLDAAKADFGALLAALAAAEMESGGEGALERADQLARYAADQDAGGEGGIVAPHWVADVASDKQLLDRLQEEVVAQGPAAAAAAVDLGLGDWMRAAGSRLLSGAIRLVDGPAERLARAATPQIARFFGDVFIYLKNGARRAQIRQAIADDLVKAALAARDDGDQLIVVGHSMGGIILYDMLSDPQTTASLSQAADGAFKIDLLVTVGTQIGLFEELDLFGHSLPGKKPGKPACVATWWHIYNQMDVLSFGVEGVIDGVTQFSIDTGANIVDAHGAYFTSPILHRRLGKRMRDASIIS